jgi:general secretion pathway protein D
MRKWLWTVLVIITSASLFAQIDSEPSFNQRIVLLKDELSEAFASANAIAAEKGSSQADYKDVLAKVRRIRKEIQLLEEAWKKEAAQESDAEPYALWDMGEATLSQLVMEFGSTDSLYVIPQELSGMKISLYAGIPLPRESWEEAIEMILAQNGIGVKRLNPFVKQLYILKLDPSAIEAVISKEEDLTLFGPQTRLFFVLAPPVEQLKALQAFFERFSDPKQTLVQAVGSKIAIVSTRETVEKLLGLYHGIWENEIGKHVRMIKLTKITVSEAEKVLKAVFNDAASKGRPNFYPAGPDELVVLSLPQGLVLVGEKETVDRGERVLQELEAQLEDPGEKVIYWYTCKHSNPEDVASVLEKVYDSLVGSNFEKRAEVPAVQAPPPPPPFPTSSTEANPVPMYPGQNTIYNPVLPANPAFIQPGVIDKQGSKTAFGNFVVDTKTTSILMVVKREELPKIKSLIRKMDVPKRMVQLDILLVEKKLTDRKQIGFNLLQIGKNSSGKKEDSITFDTGEKAINKGILSYVFSRPSGKWPAMDIVFNFLMAQDDLRINANPTVLAINQTPATVSIVEEISINNGSFPIQTESGVLIEQSYTRAQYGTTIVLTPTVHLVDNEDESDKGGFVSLQTNIEFDTTKVSSNDRPPVTRRHIENEVCVADGETVILGGLRQKIDEDSREKIPFLGDLPGIGKLFGATKNTTINTEMFIFITPHIVKDPIEGLRRLRQAEYQKRAGDIPEFLTKLDAAKNKERKRLFDQSLKTLFDMYE